MTHLLFFFPVFLRRAARVANSNTSRTPSLVLAEHSRYLVALMLVATVCAWWPSQHMGSEWVVVPIGCLGMPVWAVRLLLTCSGVTGCWLVLRSSSMVFWSKRRSFLQPTRILGTSGQKWCTSEHH